ncbi:hypothetical protein FBZ81_107352 [Azospirillum brasilense]|nr:hypothetical protein FBZ81_107352 [Azospirillum brasilense]
MTMMSLPFSANRTGTVTGQCCQMRNACCRR